MSIKVNLQTTIKKAVKIILTTFKIISLFQLTLNNLSLCRFIQKLWFWYIWLINNTFLAKTRKILLAGRDHLVLNILIRLVHVYFIIICIFLLPSSFHILQKSLVVRYWYIYTFVLISIYSNIIIIHVLMWIWIIGINIVQIVVY